MRSGGTDAPASGDALASAVRQLDVGARTGAQADSVRGPICFCCDVIFASCSWEQTFGILRRDESPIFSRPAPLAGSRMLPHDHHHHHHHYHHQKSSEQKPPADARKQPPSPRQHDAPAAAHAQQQVAPARRQSSSAAPASPPADHGLPFVKPSSYLRRKPHSGGGRRAMERAAPSPLDREQMQGLVSALFPCFDGFVCRGD